VKALARFFSFSANYFFLDLVSYFFLLVELIGFEPISVPVPTAATIVIINGGGIEPHPGTVLAN